MESTIKGELLNEEGKWIIKYTENGRDLVIPVNRNDIEIDGSIGHGSIVDFQIVEVSTEYPPYKFAMISHGFYNLNTYSKIEESIIKWSEHGGKTAGSLTREIIEIIKESNKK